MLVSNVFILTLKTGQKSSNLTTIFLLNGWLHHQLDYISELELHFQILWLVFDAPDFEAHCLFWGAEDRNDEQVQSCCFKYILVFLSSFTSTRQKKHLPMSPYVFLGWKLFIAFNFQPILSFLLAPSLFPRASAAKSTGDVFTLGDPPRSGPSLTPWKAGGEVARSVSGETPFYIGFAIMENAVWCAF